MGFLQSVFLASAALSSLAMAQGATQDMCIGYSNGNGYNVDVVYQGVQQQSMSSICGNFQKTLNNFHSFCNPGPVNCRTNSNGNLLTFGVSTSDRDSGFSCVTAAFVQTLQASVIPGPVGLGCIDLDQGTSTKKRSRIEGPVEIEPRDLSSPSSIAGIGDQITVASGRRLTLTALQFIAPAAGAVVPTLVGAISNLSPWNVVTAFDAGVNGGPGNVNANDWQIIIGALAHALQNHGSATALGAKFSDTTTGTVLLDVAMLVTQN